MTDNPVILTVSQQDFQIAKRALIDLSGSNSTMSVSDAKCMWHPRIQWDTYVALFESSAEQLNLLPEEIVAVQLFADHTMKALIDRDAYQGKVT